MGLAIFFNLQPIHDINLSIIMVMLIVIHQETMKKPHRLKVVIPQETNSSLKLT